MLVIFAEINVIFTPFANTQRYNLTFTMTAAALAAGTWVSVSANGQGPRAALVAVSK